MLVAWSVGLLFWQEGGGDINASRFTFNNVIILCSIEARRCIEGNVRIVDIAYWCLPHTSACFMPLVAFRHDTSVNYFSPVFYLGCWKIALLATWFSPSVIQNMSENIILPKSRLDASWRNAMRRMKNASVWGSPIWKLLMLCPSLLHVPYALIWTNEGTWNIGVVYFTSSRNSSLINYFSQHVVSNLASCSSKLNCEWTSFTSWGF